MSDDADALEEVAAEVASASGARWTSREVAALLRLAAHRLRAAEAERDALEHLQRTWYEPLIDALLALRRAERAGSPARVEWWTTTVQVEAGGACAAAPSLVEAVAALAALGEP